MLSFSADEIFKLGMEIELNGKAFYQAAADRCSDKEAKAAIEYLRDEEGKHYETFSKMREQLPPSAKEKTVFDPDDETTQYIKALADSRVFTNQSEAVQRAKSCTTTAEILRTALGFEKDTILLFETMKKATKEKWGQKEIDRLIEEEKVHIRKISAALSKLSK